jgi:hypothetical protein
MMFASRTRRPPSVHKSAIGTLAAYESEAYPVECNDGSIVCAYRKGAGHYENTGRVIVRRSTDQGRTWGSEIEVANDASYDTRNQCLGIDRASGRLICFYRIINASADDHIAHYFKTSTDNGVTWSSATDIDSTVNLSGDSAAFGRCVQTANGLMQLFYNVDNEAVALFSTDGGQSWGGRVVVYDLSQTKEYYEPWPIAIDDDRIVVLARVDKGSSAIENNQIAVFKSDDGGATWAEGASGEVTAQTIDNGSPCAAALTQGGQVCTAVTTRTGDGSEANRFWITTMEREAFWANPHHAVNGTAPRVEIEPLYHRHYSVTTSNSGDFGYPNLLAVRGGPLLLAWYDTVDGTNTKTACYVRSV